MRVLEALVFRAPRSLTLIASIGLLVIILGTRGVGVLAWSDTAGTSSQIKTSSALASAFNQTQQAVQLEGQLQYEYWATDDPRLQTEFYHAANRVASSLGTAARVSDTPSQQVHQTILDVSAAQRGYERAVRRLFAALSHHRIEQAREIDATRVRPAWQSLYRAIAPAASRESRDARVAAGSLQRHSLDLLVVNFVGIPLGVLCVVLFWGVLVSYRRVIDRAEEAERERVAREAVTDAVTGIGNLRAFQEMFGNELDQAQRYGHPISLALLDIDDFKLVNDWYGHVRGDELLTNFATLLASQRDRDLAFRIGGDEFAVILPNTDAEHAELAMDRLRTRVQQQLQATVSVGVVDAFSPVLDAATLRDQADAALYQAKRQGRNRVVLFTELDHGDLVPSTTTFDGIRRLLAEHRVNIVFQPIWHLERDAVLGYEALMRPLSDSGLDGPWEAFDLAERLGRTPELDLLCLQATLARSKELPVGALLFINLTPQSLGHPLITGMALRDAVTSAGLNTSQVVLEITEKGEARVSTVVREVGRLRELGFQVVLDGVGTGNTGLETLRRMPVDFIKIDRRLVIDAMIEVPASGVFAGILAFAHRTGTPVIVEGIETETMLEALQRIGDDFGPVASAVKAVQGYYFGMPSDTFPTAPGDGVVLAHPHLDRREERDVEPTA